MLEKGLAELISILLQGKKHPGLFVFPETNHNRLGWPQAQNAASVALQNCVMGETLVKHLAMERRGLEF